MSFHLTPHHSFYGHALPATFTFFFSPPHPFPPCLPSCSVLLPNQSQLRIIEREKAAQAAAADSQAKNADVFGVYPLIQSTEISGRTWSR